MQRYSPSQGYTSYVENHRQHSGGGMHVFQASPPSSSLPMMAPPQSLDSIGAVGVGGAPPIALSSHSSATPVNSHPSFDTFDDIQWPWSPPASIDSHQHQHQPSQAKQTHQPNGHAPGHYAFGFSSPNNHNNNNSFAPGSPHSPHIYNPSTTDSNGGVGGIPSYGPLSAPGSAVGSYSTSPPAMSPLTSMAPQHPHDGNFQPRSSSQQSILSSSLPVTMDYSHNQHRGSTLTSQFTFPSSPSPSSQGHHPPSHQIHTHSQSHHHHSFSLPPPMNSPQMNSDWPSSPPLSGIITGLGDSPQSPHSTISNGARPIRRRPVRKSESDTSYSSPVSAAARIQMQRSMSGNGVSQEMSISTSNGGNYMFMPSPSSPRSSTPPTVPIYLPNGGVTHHHKHSRSRSSGGSSSPGTMGMLLSTSPTSPAEIAIAMSGRGGVQVRGLSTNSALTASRSPVEERNDDSFSDFDDEEDGEGAKKRRKRNSRDTQEMAAGRVKDDAPRKSLLQPPKASPSTWQIYFTDQLQLYRSRHPEQKLNVAQAAKELAQEYKRLSNEEREPYKRRAQQAKAERDRQMAAWARTLTPDDVRQENAFRAAQRKDGKSRKANMKDPNAPKKPLSAYFMFLQRIRASPDMVKEVFGEEVGTTKQSVLAAAKWRSMSDEEKKPFLARAEQEKLMYEEKRRHYEESFADPDDPDSALYSNQHHGTSTLTSDGMTLSGHFVGIEQLSLDDTFSATGKLSNIKAFQVNTFNVGSPTKVEITDDDVREALESAMLERVNK